MKTILIMAAAAFTGMTAQAQSTETRNVNGFTGIDVQNGIELVYTQGSTEQVSVESNTTNNLYYVVTELKGKTLKVHLKSKTDADMLQNGSVKVYVTDNDTETISAASGAMVRVTNEIDVTNLNIDLKTGAGFEGRINATGTCHITTASGAGFKGNIIAGNLKTDITGGSFIRILGHAEKASVFCSGGTLIAGRFTAERADIVAKRMSSVNLYVKETVIAETDNSSAITYAGSPAKVRLADDTFAFTRK